MRVAAANCLTEDQVQTLQQWSRARSLPARQVERARVILLAAAGKQDLEIAAEIGITNQKAARWRKRYFVSLVNSGWSKMAVPKSDHPGIRLRRSARDHAPSRRGRGSALRRSIRFTLVPVAHGNGLQKFQAARRSYR
jgi:hypothetical protein